MRKSLYVRRVSRATYLRRLVLEQYVLRRLGRSARRRALPRIAVVAHDHIGDSIVIDGRYEGDILDVITEWFLPHAVPRHEAMLALDIGANIGNHTLAFAPRFAAVHAFEPNPVALHLLRANVEMNGFANVEIHAVGLGREDARLAYAPLADNLGGGRFLDRGGDAHPTREFEVRNGDAFWRQCADPRRIGLVKVDVEGMESRVFEGLASVLREHRPMVLFEALTAAACEESTAVLRVLGYTQFFTVERREFGTLPTALRVILRLIRGADVLVRRLEDPPGGSHGMVVAVARDLEIT